MPRRAAGSFPVPASLCSTGQVRLQHGGEFTALLKSTDTADPVHVRWHYRGVFAGGGSTSGSWSGTNSYVPGALDGSNVYWARTPKHIRQNAFISDEGKPQRGDVRIDVAGGSTTIVP